MKRNQGRGPLERFWLRLRFLIASPAFLVFFLVAVQLGCKPGGSDRIDVSDPPEQLSAYGLFLGDVKLQEPAAGVIPYSLNTPLFSDYAEKRRFVKLPPGQTAVFNGAEVLSFPVGTVIAKTFGYALDPNAPNGALNLIETRILVHDKDQGWVGLPYIWNEEQTEARLAVIGGRRDVEWTKPSGEVIEVDYRVPNKNQCKGCHRVKGRVMQPIGPRSGQLNGEFAYAQAGPVNQLDYWRDLGALTGLPAPHERPVTAIWDDPSSGSLGERARAWLDVNCAHCHNPEGPARTSNLDLQYTQRHPSSWGVGKAPVAAGRGSGGRSVDIQPGDPDRSILIYRLESNDPGIQMPELGRSLVHKEGVELIREWILSLNAS